MPDPVDLTQAIDRAFLWGVAQPLRALGYRTARRHAHKRVNDLYLWLQLLGRSWSFTESRRFELVGGIAVEMCLPSTRSPHKPWQWSQATVQWQSINYVFEPGGDARRGFLTSHEELIETLRVESQRFSREIDQRFSTAADVREALWDGTVQSDPLQGPGHLAGLLAVDHDERRLERRQQSQP